MTGVVLTVEITVSAESLIRIALIGNAVAIEIGVARIDQAISVGIELAGVVLAVGIAVCSKGQIDITGVRDSVTVDVQIAGVDDAVQICVDLAVVILAIGVTVHASSLIRITGVVDAVSVVIRIRRTDQRDLNRVIGADAFSNPECGQSDGFDVFDTFPGRER